MTTYKEVCEAWPDPMPIPTPAEAIAGVKRLIRVAHRHAREEGIHFGMRPYKFRITTGNRQTQQRSFTWHINCNEDGPGRQGGWGEIVHSISHWAMRKYWPKESPHVPRHVYIERMLADYARKHFLDGQLIKVRKVTAPVDKIALRATRVAERIRKWEAKRRRAEAALKKLRKQERYYGRRGMDNSRLPAPVAAGEPAAPGRGSTQLEAEHCAAGG